MLLHFHNGKLKKKDFLKFKNRHSEKTERNYNKNSVSSYANGGGNNG